MTLPRSVRPYDSVEAICYRARNFISNCVSLNEVHSFVLATFVLYTWFADRLPKAVYLVITGAPQSGKTTLLETLKLLCRRSLLVANITTAAMDEACRFCPTLFIDEAEWTSDRGSTNFRKQLRAGTNRNVWAKQLRHSGHSFCPKVLASLELSDDAALNSRCVRIPMVETDRTDLWKPWDPQVMKIAEGLRGQLLQLRLERIRAIGWKRVVGSETLRPRSRDMLESLAAPLDGSKDFIQLLLAFFGETHDPATQEILSPDQSATLISLWRTVHLMLSVQSIQIKNLARAVNAIRQSSGERGSINPRKLSNVLNSLGLQDRVRATGGSNLNLGWKACTQIHILRRRYGWDHPEMPTFSGCRFCQEPSSEQASTRDKNSRPH